MKAESVTADTSMDVTPQKRGGTIGILGGMGPLATVDLLQKIYLLSPATADQQHLPILIHADPSVPDRSKAISDPAAPSPLPALLDGIRILERGGASFIAIACNTAHCWLQPLREATRIPILDMVEIACAAVAERHSPGTPVGVLGTAGTIARRLYHSRLDGLGFPCFALETDRDVQDIESIIASVKANKPKEGKTALLSVISRLIDRGARVVLLGCTELPIAWSMSSDVTFSRGFEIVDSTMALAAECVRRGFELRGDCSSAVSTPVESDRISQIGRSTYLQIRA